MIRLLGLALLLLGIVQLGFRGMQRVRHDVPLWDFVSVHAASRTWIQSGDPYNLPQVVQTWKGSGIFSDRDVSYFATVYLPTSLLALAPLATLPAGVAMVLWLLLTLVLLGLQFAALGSLMGWRWSDPRLVLLIGASIASGPLQFGILSGQLSLPAISLCILAFWCVDRKWEILAGVLLGLACVIKPQMGGPFVLYYLAMRHYRVAAFAIVLGGGISLLAFGLMQWTHSDWINNWRQSVALTTKVGGVNDYGWAGVFRDEIINLKMILVSLIHSATLLKLAVYGLFAILFAWYVRAFPRQRDTRTEVLVLAGLSALSLLPIYHRVYDVTILTLALAWALNELKHPHRLNAWMMLLPMTIFLVPFGLTRTIAKRSARITEIADSGWFQTWLAPHYAWGLLLVTVAILLTMQRIKSSQSVPASSMQAVS